MTLGFACMLAAAWTRSMVVEDSLVTFGHPNAPFERGLFSAGWVKSRQGRIERITSLAHGKGGKPMPGTCYRQWFVRYDSIVIPLTFVSAWLLISRPRKRTTTPIPS